MMSLGPEPLHRGQKLNWNHPVALIGEKVSDPAMHFCEICDLPILVYGRMLPCKHVFCYDCALKAERKCTRCNDPVTRVERCELGQIYLCTFGAPKHSYKACRRTYLSQRDLQAHVNHRHSSKTGSASVTAIPSSGPPPTSAAVIRPPQAQRQASRHHHGQSTSALSGHQVGSQSNVAASIPVHRPPPAATTTRGNLITIQLQGDHSAAGESAAQQGARRTNQR